MSLSLVFCGLSITSAWGNGHAVTYRGLVRELARRGHSVLFLERDAPWYAANRDRPEPEGCRLALYDGLDELRREHGRALAQADLVVVGSYVPDGVQVCRLVLDLAKGLTAFYDIDTPVTLAALERGTCAYLAAEAIPAFDLYLSFTGGPTLNVLEDHWGARAARPLHCSADAEVYFPEARPARWDLGYLGTYSPDRQPGLETLLAGPARTWPEGRFAVFGPQYPEDLAWPANVERRDHLPPDRHRGFYGAQRFTLNVTRADMVRAGWSPSIRLFEAAACGTPIVSDWWDGLETFFTPYEEILPAASARDVMLYLRDLAETERGRVAEAGRQAVMDRHTAARRAAELERYVEEALRRRRSEGREVVSGLGDAAGGQTGAARPSPGSPRQGRPAPGPRPGGEARGRGKDREA